MTPDLEKVLKTDELVRQKVELTKQEADKILQNARKTAQNRLKEAEDQVEETKKSEIQIEKLRQKQQTKKEELVNFCINRLLNL